MHNYAVITQPLNALMKKDVFKLSIEAPEVFDALKFSLSKAPVHTLLIFMNPLWYR